MPSKQKSEFLHARRRLKERFGIDLTRKLRRQIKDDIRRGRCQVLTRPSNRVTMYLVDVKGISMRVAYDRQRKEIITVLPRR